MRVKLSTDMGSVTIDNVDEVVDGLPLHLVKGNVHTLTASVLNDDGTAANISTKTGVLFISGKALASDSSYKFNYSGANITEDNLAGGVFSKVLATTDLDDMYVDFIVEVGYLSSSNPVTYGVFHVKVIRGTRN